MKKVNIDSVTTGQKIARPIIDKSGNIIVDTGKILDSKLIDRLKKREITYLYIEKIKETIDSEDITFNTLEEISAYFEKIPEKINSEKIQNKLITFLKEKPDINTFRVIKNLLIDSTNIQIDPHDFIILYRKTGDTKIKELIFSIIKKYGQRPDVIIALLKTMHENTNELNKKLYTYFSNIEKTLLKRACYVVLGENNEELNGLVSDVMRRLNLEGRKKITEKVRKIEKIQAVKKAEEELFGIKVRKRLEVKNFDTFNEEEWFEKYKIRNKEVKKLKYTQKNIELNDEDIIECTYLDHIDILRDILKKVRGDELINIELLEKIASYIITAVRHKPEFAIKISENSTENNYVLSHSINTAYIAVLIGHLKGYMEDTLMEIAVSALLHDIGMVKVQDLVWNIPRRLTSEEFFEIKKHTIYGMDYIMNSTNLSSNIARVCYLHHEKLDGTGYPKGKNSTQLNNIIKIVSLADSFDSMTSTRAYRQGNDYNFAFLKLFNKFRKKYDQDTLRLLYRFFVEKIDNKLSELGKVPKLLLIVDDYASERRLVKHFVQTDFPDTVEVMLAEDGKQALDLILERGEEPDIILLDISMPEIDGFQVLEELKAKQKHLPVIMLSGDGSKETVSKAYKTGVVRDYIIKPIQNNTFKEKLSKFID